MSEPLGVSMSALASFMRCRRQYYYLYELGLEPKTSSEAAMQGSAFHQYMEEYARDRMAGVVGFDSHDAMGDVAETYLLNNDFPEGRDIIFAETPLYTPLLAGNDLDEPQSLPLGVTQFPSQPVWLRTTFDLCYRKDGWIFVRDYKTFDKATEHDLELDFQGKLYAAVARKHFKTDRVMFEYEYVRRTPPGVPKDKAGKCWTPEECYSNVPVYAAQHELDELWSEAQDVARDLLRAKAEGRWYRQPIKGHFNGCGSCFARNLCSADLKEGGLDEQEIEFLATKREPITLPKELV